MYSPQDFIEHGIEIRNGATGNVKVDCPQCTSKKRDKPLSVNVDEGIWRCHRCDWKGSLKGRRNNDDVIRQLDRNARRLKYSKPAPLPPSPLTPAAQQWLSNRAIPYEVAEGVGIVSERDSISIPYKKDGELVNIKYRSIMEKRFGQSKGGMPILWRYDECMKHDRIIICEGEMDALALLACGYENVTSIPAGADANADQLSEDSAKFDFLVNSKELIDNAKEVLLWLDDDEAGRGMQRELVRRIGKKKCMYIPDTFGHKDANDMLNFEGVDTVNEVLSQAKHYPIDSVLTYADAIADIAAHDPLKKVGASTGFPTFDDHFRLATGDLCVIVGIPESGKSEFCDQIILNSISGSGWKWAYYTPENMPIERHFVRVAEKWNKKPYYNITDMEKAETIGSLSKYMFMINPTEGIGIDALLDRVDALVYRHGINAFILDPWNEVEHKRPSQLSETEYIGQVLQKCRMFARNHGILFIIVAHPTKLHKRTDGEYPVPTPYDISGSANWRNKADSCLSVWRPFKGDTTTVDVHVCKMRNKYAGKNGMVQFKFDILTGTYSEVPRYTDDEVQEDIGDKTW